MNGVCVAFADGFGYFRKPAEKWKGLYVNVTDHWEGVRRTFLGQWM